MTETLPPGNAPDPPAWTEAGRGPLSGHVPEPPGGEIEDLVSRPYRARHLTAFDGTRLFYRDYGPLDSPLPPALCLSGLTRHSNDFHDLASHFSAERRVICPDYRGRGRSGRNRDWRKYEATTLLRDTLDLLTALDLHEVVCIGISMGGLLSMALNVARPGAVRAVVLNDIGPEIVRHGVGRIVDHIAHDHPQPDWDTALAWQKENFHHLRRFTEHDWRVLCEGSFVEGEDGWLHVSWDIRLARAMVADRRSGPSLWPLFLSLRDKPVLTFRGAESDVLTAQGLAAMARAKPDMICRTVDNVGHVPVLDWPECRAEITRFLAALDS